MQPSLIPSPTISITLQLLLQLTHWSIFIFLSVCSSWLILTYITHLPYYSMLNIFTLHILPYIYILRINLSNPCAYLNSPPEQHIFKITTILLYTHHQPARPCTTYGCSSPQYASTNSLQTHFTTTSPRILLCHPKFTLSHPYPLRKSLFTPSAPPSDPNHSCQLQIYTLHPWLHPDTISQHYLPPTAISQLKHISHTNSPQLPTHVYNSYQLQPTITTMTYYTLSA